MTDWYVGQKVVCVWGDSQWKVGSLWLRLKEWWQGSANPVAGGIYVISKITVHTGESWKVGLYLLGFHQRWFYNADGFRPLVSQDADISVFTKLLEPLNKRENADA